MNKKKPSEDNIPRFVLSITDTTIKIPGPNGEMYYSINVGADKLSDFNKLIPKKKRTNHARTELQNMFYHFQKAVDDFYMQDKIKEAQGLQEAQELVRGNKDGKKS